MIRTGDVVVDANGRKSIVVKIGRGAVRSALLLPEDDLEREPKLVLEIDFWVGQGSFTLHNSKPANRRWAAAYRKAHPDLPDV